MSDRTDLFKALNAFMGIIAAQSNTVQPEVTMEVGDSAFRAFERAHGGACVSGAFDVNLPSGRVVIRRRPVVESCWVCGKPAHVAMRLDTKDGTVSVHHFCSEAGVVRARHESREAQLEREKASAHENVPAPPGTMPKQEREPCRCGNCWLCSTDERRTTPAPPEETKPPARECCEGGDLTKECAPCPRNPTARAHLKGCALDTDHKEGCYVPFVRSGLYATMASLTETSDAAPAVALDRDLRPPTLSPRQALGEALACVERARGLVGGLPPSTPNLHHVARGVDMAYRELIALYEAAK